MDHDPFSFHSFKYAKPKVCKECGEPDLYWGYTYDSPNELPNLISWSLFTLDRVPHTCNPRRTDLNLSAAILLVRTDAVFPVRVEYDPDNKYNNNPTRVFKTVDPSIKKDDLVIVTTNTRQGFTVVKVTEVDFAVDYNSSEQWGWVAAKFDVDAFRNILKIEEGVQERVAKAQENKMRKEIIDAMGLGEVSFTDLQLRRVGAATPDGVQVDEAASGAPTAPEA